MSQVAMLRWRWQAVAPLVTGYSQNLAEAAGKIERGQRQVINLETHNPQGQLQPSFLAASVKGVFRAAAVWLVERTAREQGATTYITCDYGRDVPDSWRPRLGLVDKQQLCPVSQVFGGAGCIGDNDDRSSLRQKSLVSFSFSRANDATYGRVTPSPVYRFAWEQIDNKGKPLRIDQLHFEPDTVLEARLEPANDFAVALLLLAADLISSGFFRFGRFTSRGYGVVRLIPDAYFYGPLLQLLSQDALPWTAVSSGISGSQVKFNSTQDRPMQLIWDKVNQAVAAE
jgi:hypothetical protein